MACCYVPFSSRNLEISFFAFKPTVVCVDDLMQVMTRVSAHAGSLGCVHSSVFRSIHGNLIIWYAAWMKRSMEDKQALSETLLSLLTNVSSMAILHDHSFFDAYAGESRDGWPAAKFFVGDVVTMSSVKLFPNATHGDNASHAFLAVFKDQFIKMAGAKSGVCLKSQTTPHMLLLVAWKSLQSCYDFILTSDHQRRTLPYLENLALDTKYDVFRVMHVSGDHGTSGATALSDSNGGGEGRVHGSLKI